MITLPTDLQWLAMDYVARRAMEHLILLERNRAEAHARERKRRTRWAWCVAGAWAIRHSLATRALCEARHQLCKHLDD